MIYSNNRKLSLSGWLQERKPDVYSSSLCLQKFLFFYEVFSKTEENKADFDHLRGYIRGPVFSNVYGDYTKERQAFNCEAEKEYQEHGDDINGKRAERAAFLVSSLSEKELSELTHRFHIWNAKKEQIMSGWPQVTLEEADFNREDRELTENLKEMYPDELITGSQIIAANSTRFVFSIEDAKNLTEQHMDTLSQLAERGGLHNPVFVEIDETGGLLID